MRAIVNKHMQQCIPLNAFLEHVEEPLLLSLPEGMYSNLPFRSIMHGPLYNNGVDQMIPTQLLIELPFPLHACSAYLNNTILRLHDGTTDRRWILFQQSRLAGRLVYNGSEISNVHAERQLLKSSEERLSEFFNNISEAMFIAEDHQAFFPLISVNKAFLTLFNIAKADVIGLDVLQVVGSKLAEQLRKCISEVCKDGKTDSFDAIIRTGKRSKHYSIHLMHKEDDDSGHSVIFGAINDITALRTTASELEETKNRAEAFSRLKTSLLANLSHEIRTPLNGINGFAQILLEELEGSQAQNYVHRILTSSGRLLATLNSLIDLSRLEAENYSPNKSRIDGIGFIKGLLAEYEQLITARGLLFKSRIPDYAIVLETDTYLLKSILDKLIDNAVKYTVEGSVSLNVQHTETDIFIMVKDTGIGIREKDHSAIFDEFWQVTAGMERSHEGLGVGLTLARKMLKLMKGEIQVSSQPGQGSTFTIKYPLGTV